VKSYLQKPVTLEALQDVVSNYNMAERSWSQELDVDFSIPFAYSNSPVAE
jgi:hypothetical protein